MQKDSKIFVAGKDGVAGSAIVRLLMQKGYKNLILPTYAELDFCNQKAVETFFQNYQPEYVFYSAAKMGSIIYRNEHPSDILYTNLIMQTNIIHAAHENKVKGLLFMSSDFIYPNIENRPLREEDFLTDTFGKKDMPYTLAKTVGVKMCDYYRQEFGDNFFTVVPCAFFGINASFDLQQANVVGSLIKRFHDAKENGDNKFFLWGSGKPQKEFLFCDDVASACVFLMNQEDHDSLTNIGVGNGGITIMELAETIRKVVGFSGEIHCDLTKPDGIMFRVMDSSKLQNLGWKPKYNLEQALNITYQHFLTTPYAK